MVYLSDLPVELLVRILGVLSPTELASCTRLSKRFLNVTRASLFLTYILELGKAGLEKPYFLTFDESESSESNSADLLAALRKRELGLSKFVWNEHWEMTVGKKYTFWEVCGSVLIAGLVCRYEDEIRNRFTPFDAMDAYDFCDDNSKAPITKLVFNKLYDNCAFDPGQDLLILVERYTPTDRYHKLHIRSLSGGRQYGYVELNTDTISIPVPDDEEYRESRYDIGVCGDIILFPHFRGLTIINWKTGHFLAINLEFDPGSFTCRLISEREFLTVGHRGEGPLVEYYTLHGSELTSTESMDRVVFSLPFTDNRTPDKLVWEPAPSFSPPMYTPKLFSPFVKPSTLLYPSKAQIIHLQFFSDSVPMSGAYPDPFDMFVHVDQLRHVKNTYSDCYPPSSAHVPAVPIIPWDVWGPNTTRVFERIISDWDDRNIRGYRALVYMDEVALLDFDSKSWTSSTPNIIQDESRVLISDKVEVASSLPYRKIPLTPSQRDELPTVPSYLLGDDLICIDVGEDLELDYYEVMSLHVFHF